MTLLDIEILKDINAIELLSEQSDTLQPLVNVLNALHEQVIMLRERLDKLDKHEYL